ncbi:MAG: hypothetical protein ACHQ2E_03375 [Gemmatimonadales bacterium]
MSSRCVLLAVSLAPLVGLGACQSAQLTPSLLALTVDSAVYHRRGQSPLAVPFTLANNGATPVYLPQCDGSPAAVIDRWMEGTWRFLQGGFCNGAQPPLLVLPPRQSARGVVTIYESGAYRLRVSATADTSRASDDGTFSKEFDVW